VRAVFCKVLHPHGSWYDMHAKVWRGI